MAFRGARQKIQNRRSRRPRRGHEKQFSNRAGALFLPALCRFDCRRVPVRAFDLGLGTASGLVPSSAWGRLLFSRHTHRPYFADAPERYHQPGLSLLLRHYFSGQHFGLARWRAAPHARSFRAHLARSLVARVRNFPAALQTDFLALVHLSDIYSRADTPAGTLNVALAEWFRRNF